MSETLSIWLFGVYGAAIVTLFGLFFKTTIALIELNASMRAIVTLLGKRAAGILHSPHTAELDGLIEKFQKEIISPEEMQHFFDMLVRVEGGESGGVQGAATKYERLLASLVLLNICHDPKYLKFNLGDRIERHRKKHE